MKRFWDGLAGIPRPGLRRKPPGPDGRLASGPAGDGRIVLLLQMIFRCFVYRNLSMISVNKTALISAGISDGSQCGIPAYKKE